MLYALYRLINRWSDKACNKASRLGIGYEVDTAGLRILV